VSLTLILGQQEFVDQEEKLREGGLHAQVPLHADRTDHQVLAGQDLRGTHGNAVQWRFLCVVVDQFSLVHVMKAEVRCQSLYSMGQIKRQLTDPVNLRSIKKTFTNFLEEVLLITCVVLIYSYILVLFFFS
jgi:hypothetical protein